MYAKKKKSQNFLNKVAFPCSVQENKIVIGKKKKTYVPDVMYAKKKKKNNKKVK